MELIQYVILVFVIFALSRIPINLKERNLGKLEAIFWTTFWTLAIFATIFPELVIWVSDILGVERGVDLIIYITIIVLAYLIFRLYAKLTRIQKNITKIVRKIAIDKR